MHKTKPLENEARLCTFYSLSLCTSIVPIPPDLNMFDLRINIVSLSKQRFCQHERHQKINITNIGAILHHSARVLKGRFPLGGTFRAERNFSLTLSFLISSTREITRQRKILHAENSA
jgi:hypothetical protein